MMIALRLVSRFATIALLAGAAGACSSESPVAPAPVTGFTRLLNFQARQLGLGQSLCGTGFSYTVHDELTMDVFGRDVSMFLGGTLLHVLDDGTETLLGVVRNCSDTITPCSGTNVCIRKGTGELNRIQVYARIPWTPQRRWNVFLRSGTRDSNRVTATIARSDNLPYGNTAAFAFVDAQRSFTTSGSFSVLAWSPGIANRRIFITYETWSNGVRVFSSSTSSLETTPGLVGVTGGIIIGTGPTELIATLEERDPNGALIATDRRTVPVR